MAKFDFDAAIAELHVEYPHEITVGGKVYKLPATLSLEAALAMHEDDIPGVIRAVLPPEAAREILSQIPADKQGAGVIADMFRQLYGVTAGESEASAGSSPNGGVQSRPMSSLTTESTLEHARPVDSGS